MRAPRFMRGAQGALGLLLSLVLALATSACIDPKDGGGSTTGTTVYVYDGGANGPRVLVWDDAAALYDAPATAPARTFTSTRLSSNFSDLSLGGLCANRNTGHLYLVSKTGKVARVARARSQSGTLSTSDIVIFNLGQDADHISGGEFGQAAVDPGTGTLYVAETKDGGQARLWMVANPASVADNTTLPVQSVPLDSGDQSLYGVAAGSGGRLFTFFNAGSDITVSATVYSGPRIRLGSSASAGSGSSNVIIGSTPMVFKYGCLGADSDNELLYVGRHLADLGKTTEAPIHVFRSGQFSSGLDAAPDRTRSAGANITALRALSHPGNKDWLAGLEVDGPATATPGFKTYFLLWKSPSTQDAHQKVDLSTLSVSVRGVALCGDN